MSASIYDRKVRDVASEIKTEQIQRNRERIEEQKRRDRYYQANFPNSPLTKQKDKTNGNKPSRK